MIRRTAAALLLAVAALLGGALPAPARPAHPALWVVRDRDTTIYLFGTVHVLKPGLDWFAGPIKQAFDRSGSLVLEIKPGAPGEVDGLVAAIGRQPAGSTLTAQLPAAKRPAFAHALGTLGLDPATFDAYRPWLAATALSLLPLQQAGYTADQGPETILAAAAQAAHKPVEGLETTEQQLHFVADLPPSLQLAFLDATVVDLPEATHDAAEMVEDWATGQPDKLARLLNEDVRDTPELARILLVDRNRRWAKWVETRLKTPGTVFVAVGAGHLAGGDSVQADLAKDGVKVKRVG